MPFHYCRYTLYVGLLNICLELEACTVFQMWGGVDGWSDAYSGLNAYPFNVDYRPKKAFYGMVGVMLLTCRL